MPAIPVASSSILRVACPPTGARRRAALGALLLTALGAAGCQRSLFQQNLPRNQFQTYEEMRGEFAPAQETDVFGRPQPALRARLVRSQ